MQIRGKIGDLRDRHRRRCEKSIEKGQTPKKKSCQSCARSKVKCDLQIPACQRCLDRHTICEYPIDSSTAALSQLSKHNQQNIEDPTISAQASIPESFMMSQTNLETSNGLGMGTMPDPMGPVVVDDVNMDWEPGLDDDALNFWEFGPWNSNSTDSVLPQMTKLDFPWTFPSQDANGQLPDFRVPSIIGNVSDLGDKNMFQPREEPLSPTSSTRSGSEAASTILSRNSNKRSRTGDGFDSMGFANAQRQAPSQSHSSRNSISDRTFGQQSDPAFSFTPTSSIGAPDLTGPLQTSLAALDSSLKSHGSSLPSPPRFPMRSLMANGSGLFSMSDIMNVICDYPKHMLRPNFWSPFVHHRHYRCSQGGLAEPIAIALCCVSASRQSVESSNPFVCRMINDQRENLVNDFAAKAENLEDAIAVLHAMCIYQIETILTYRMQKGVKPRSSNKDLYHHFLLKMTRRLCEQHTEGIALKDNNSISWTCWTMAETLRRTAYLVDMVNELSYHTGALAEIYYEPLQESLLQDMPLPAPESMWRSLNEDEWQEARDATGWTADGVVTLGKSLERLDNRESALMNGGFDVEGRKSDNFQHISKLIISSAKHLKRK